MPKKFFDPDEWATNTASPANRDEYKAQVLRAGGDWASGIEHGEGTWADGVQRAVTAKSFSASGTPANAAKYTARASTKGATNWLAGVGAAAAKTAYAANFKPWADAMAALHGNLSPRGARGSVENIARALFWVQSLSDLSNKVTDNPTGNTGTITEQMPGAINPTPTITVNATKKPHRKKVG